MTKQLDGAKTPMNTGRYLKRVFLALVVLLVASAVLVGAGSAGVAKIGTAEYDTLQAAIDAAGVGDTITLLGDITVAAEDGNPETHIWVKEGKDVIIDLNGNTVTGAFFINGKATIKNGNIVNTNVVSGIETQGDLTLEDMIITSNRHAVRVSGGNVHIISGTYTSTAASGSCYTVNIGTGGNGVVPTADITAIIDGGTFTPSDNAETQGPSIMIKDDRCTVSISGGVFNQGRGEGHFRCLENYGSMTVTGGTFNGGLVTNGNLISGGTFTVDPSSNIAEGYKVLNEEGKYTVVAIRVAQIGDTTYSTLQRAIDAANDGDTIILLADVEWATSGQIDGNPLTDHSITIDGQSQYKFTATGDGIGEIRVTSGTLTLKNLNVVDNSVSYDEDAWEFGYLEFGGNLVAENVIFNDPILFKGTSAEFTKCIFTGKTTEMTQYGCWIHNGDVATFTECTFQGTRGLKAHSAYGNVVFKLTVSGSTFTCTEKPGIALGDVTGSSVSITSNTFNGVAPGDQNQFTFESDTPLDEFAMIRSGNTISGISGITNIEEGTYEYDPTNYLAAGKVVVPTSNGMYEVKSGYLVSFIPGAYTVSGMTSYDNITASETKTFTISPNSGKKVTGVTATNATIINDGNDQYTLKDAIGSVTVTVTLEDIAKNSGSSSQGSSVWLQEPATPTPTPTPTETVPTDTVPTDIPSTQPTATPSTPGFGVLAVLAGLGAVVALRRQ